MKLNSLASRASRCTRGSKRCMAVVGLLSLTIALPASQAQGPVSSGFTYQGRLVEEGLPATGAYDLQFRLFTAPTTPPGVQVGGTQVLDNISVTNGLFTVRLDFGNQYNGAARWLDVGVHPGAQPPGDPYTLLSPRQELTAAPYAQAVRLPLDESISSSSSALSITNNGTGAAGAFHGPDNNGTTAALKVTSGSQTMLFDGNELDSLDAAGLFLNNNVDFNVCLASGGGHVGVGNTAPQASLTVGSPGILNVFVPGDSTCFQAHATPGCSDEGCENLVCADDAFCCSNAWDSVCVGQANDRCIGRVGIGTSAAEARVHITGGSDAALEGGGFLVAGSIAGANIAIDNNEIVARNNGASATLAINAEGGNVTITGSGAGNVGIGTTSPQRRLHIANGSSGGTSHANAALVVESNAHCYVGLMTPDASERGLTFGSPTSGVHGGVYYSNADGIGMRTGGNATRVNIDAGGNMGVGTIGHSIDARLHVQSNANRAAKFDRYGGDGELVAFARDDSVMGTITVAGGTVSYNAFTGSHYAWLPEPLERGTLVTLTGENRRSSEGGEVIYGAAVTTKPNDPACLGAYLAPHAIAESPAKTDEHQIMSVGNGELWVIDRGKDIAPGDPLISSDVSGCVMRDDPAKFPIGHIVARAAETVRWNDLKAAADGPRRVRISVLFDRFTRGADEATLIAMSRELQALRARLEALEKEASGATTSQ